MAAIGDPLAPIVHLPLVTGAGLAISGDAAVVAGKASLDDEGSSIVELLGARTVGAMRGVVRIGQRGTGGDQQGRQKQQATHAARLTISAFRPVNGATGRGRLPAVRARC